MKRLTDEDLRGVVRINWNVGGLHFSQNQEFFSSIGPKDDFINVRITHTNTHTGLSAAESQTRSGEERELPALHRFRKEKKEV